MMDYVLNPCKVSIACRGGSIPPALVLTKDIAAPIADVKGRICKDVISLEIGMTIVVERVAVSNLTVNPADSEIHTGEPPGRVVGLLSVNTDVTQPSAMCCYEFFRLNEHARRSTTWVVNPSLIRLQDLDKQPDNATRGIELAALFALGARELRKEIFIDPANNILGSTVCVAYSNVGDKVDSLSQSLLVKCWSRVVLWEDSFEGRIVALDSRHRIVDKLSNGGLFGLCLDVRPACFRWNPENVECTILVRILGVGALTLF